MKIFSLFVAAAEKSKRFGVLPEHSSSFAFAFEAFDYLLQVNWNELLDKCLR